MNATEAVNAHLVLASRFENIEVAERALHDLCSAAGCDGDQLYWVVTALREALANAVIHGNESDPKKKVIVTCSFSRSRGARLVVRDQGSGFDPRKVPDPRDHDRRFLHHGRGLLLMRALVDRVEHRDGGREVVLHKAPCASARRRSAGPARLSGGA